MREESWHKMLLVALLLHVFIVAAFSLNIKKPVRRIDLSHYSVTLVGDIGGGAGAAPKTEAHAIPDTGKKASPPPAVQKKVEPKKTTPIPEPKEKERPISTTKEKSLTPAKKESPKPETNPTDDEVRRLDQRIREMKSRQYVDVVSGKSESVAGKGVGGTGAPSTSSGGGSGPLDPQTRYMLEVYERIREAWHVPTLLASKKGLATAVSIKIRKDGRIIDWTVDERSGNRVYDESVARALRTIDKLPPVPDSLPDPFDAPFRFLPPDQ